MILVHCTLESKKMAQIYKHGRLLSAQKLFSAQNPNWQLNEEKDPKHISKLSKAWKAKNGVDILYWPANTLDLNLTKNVWVLLKAKICLKNIKKVSGLIYAFK